MSLLQRENSAAISCCALIGYRTPRVPPFECYHWLEWRSLRCTWRRSVVAFALCHSRGGTLLSGPGAALVASRRRWLESPSWGGRTWSGLWELIGPSTGSSSPWLKPSPCPHCRFYFQCVRLRWESGAMIKNRICCRLPFTPTTQENIHRNSLVPVLFTPQPFTRLWTKPQGKTSNWTLKYLKSLIAGFRIIFQWLTSIGQSTSGGVGYKHLRCNINENGRLNSF